MRALIQQNSEGPTQSLSVVDAIQLVITAEDAHSCHHQWNQRLQMLHKQDHNLSKGVKHKIAKMEIKVKLMCNLSKGLKHKIVKLLIHG